MMTMNHTNALRQACSISLQISVFFFQLLLSAEAFATNGFNLIGFGAESSLMAGADIAVARDTSALNTNPAGLTQIKGRAFDGFGSMLRTFDLAHKDSFGNDVEASNKYTFLGGGGYAQSLDSLPCTAGVGLFAQGGAGGVFKDIKTAFGNSDELSSLFAIAKVIPGIGCQINDKLSIGASLAIVYAGIDQKFFPNTSSAVAPFVGYDIEGASALRTGIKLGVMYQLTPQVKVAATYTDKTELPLTDGSLTADYSAQGLGKVKYRNAGIDGFALPREIALGMAITPSDKWLLSFKVNWISWSDAINSVTLHATDPVNPLAPAAYGGVTPGNWSNQLVFATGVAYTLDEKTTLYGGYNYGRNPVPDKNVSPLLAAILEHHVTLGMARQISPEWKFIGGMEYLAPAKVEYTSPLFGQAEVRNEGLFLHFMLSRRW